MGSRRRCGRVVSAGDSQKGSVGGYFCFAAASVTRGTGGPSVR